jgi:hypothetical protein
MSKIRTLLSLVILVLLIVAAYPFGSASARVNSNPSYDPADSAVVIRYAGESARQMNAPVPADPYSLQLCVNPPFGAVASVYACPNPNQVPAFVNSDPGESTNKLNVPGSSNPGTQVKCVNAPFGAVASVFACPNPSQIPLPEWLITGEMAPNK